MEGYPLEIWLYSAIAILVFCMAAHWLYARGIAVSKSIAAVLFVFRPGKNADRVTLNSCTGWFRHRGRFRETRIYEFTFTAQLSTGHAEAVLLDRAKQPLLTLDSRHPAGTIKLEGGNRYYLHWNFANASGTCGLRWKCACVPNA